MKVYFYVIFLFLLNSCTSNTQIAANMDIKDVVEKFDHETFSDFNGFFVSIRQRVGINTIYILQKDNLPVYFITYNNLTNSITEINDSLLKKQNAKNYLLPEEINYKIKKFRQYGFMLLSVDKFNNVFIDPFHINNTPVLLRLDNSSNLKMIKRSPYYHHYKNNWYMNDQGK